MSVNKIFKGYGYKAQLDICSCKGSTNNITVCLNQALEMVPVS